MPRNLNSIRTQSSPVISGITTLGASAETTQSISITGSTTINYANGSVCYVSSITGAHGVTISNAPTTDNQTIVVTLIVNQGATPYVPASYTLNSTSQTVNWLSGSTPTGNANKKDVISYISYRISGAWVTLASLNTYG